MVAPRIKMPPLTYVMISMSASDMGLESLAKVPRPAGLLGDSSQHPVVILQLLLKRMDREREGGNG